MSEEKTLRLNKVAKELNVGMSTLVETLAKNGHDVKPSPNTKIGQDLYVLLLKEHQTDQQVKEKSRQMGSISLPKSSVTIQDKKKEEEDEPSDDGGAEILIKDTSLAAEEEAGSAETQARQPEAKAPEEPAKEAPKEEAPIAEAPKEEAPKEETPKEETPKEETPKEESPKPSGGLKVLGKIELPERQAKGKAAKKVEPKAEDKQEKAKAKAKEEALEPKAKESPAPEVETPSVQAEEPAKEKAPEAEAQTQAKTEATEKAHAEEKATQEESPAPVADSEEKKTPEEVIRAKVNRLEGPTVVGKIELPKEAPKKDSGERKKRKRIPKELNKRVPPAGGQNQSQGGAKKGGRGRRRDVRPDVKVELTEEEIQKQIKETLARLSARGKSKAVKFRRQKREGIREKLQSEAEEVEREKKVLKVTEFVSANELSQMMEVPVTDIISACMSLGLFVSINQRLDAETISIISEEFGYEVNFVSADIQEAIDEEEVDNEEDLEFRPPIVTVMGHVDHGKTSLLDYVRKANVIAGEAGGITQHIGAYGVQLENGKQITFIDTPGHEAFTAMRARGAQITDVAIIVIAADDSVMPQTVEAINHAKAAGVPIVFAINKIDKDGANPDKIREALANMNYLVEEWGGKYQCQEISAKKGLNITDLLDKVLLESEMLELKANPKRRATGVTIEAQLDKGRGYVCTLLVQNGSLSIGDVVLAGPYSGRVKALYNERGVPVKTAGPAMPVRMLGLSGAPQAGDKFHVMDDEREAREIATKRQQLQREQGIRSRKHITLDEIGRRIAIGDFQQLNVIIKADTDGSAEALTDSLLKLSTESIQVNIIHKSVGAISESDVMLASASDAIIIGFQVRPSASVRKLADAEEIDIRTYSVIYQAIEEVKAAMEGMLAPTLEEQVTANVEVRDVFSITKVGTVAGCYVLDGKIQRNNKVRVIRDGIVVHTGKLSSLKRFKDDVKEVATGYECGLTLEKFNDIQLGDIIESFEEVEVKRKL
jgi:translation initiation factor IF-2